MDIETIDVAIEELKNSDTTVENVSELASLYIVRQNLLEPFISDVTKELSDILPNYLTYVSIKRKYQMGSASESEVVHSIKAVCKELKEFFETLYYGTDMNKERLCIRELLKELYEEHNK